MICEGAQRPTLGLISTWPIYQGTTIDRYAHALIQGISAAARGRGCNLLLGCGFSAKGNDTQRHSFWPVPGPGVDFVPVGPWNTDGLIIVPDELNAEQLHYARDLLASGFPVIFTTPEGPGPVVAVDNAEGIRQAFRHLWEHGHRQIAFIAGNPGGSGDSEERLRAYRDALRAAGLPEDPRLVATGDHRRAGGHAAMRQILASDAPFSAVIASNDLSCLGATQCLAEAGRRIPDDVAVVGFDDIPDARALSPSLTTVRHPTFHIGYQAVVTLLEYIDGLRQGPTRVIIPPKLIVRQSCGCPAGGGLLRPASASVAEAGLDPAGLVQAMTEAAWVEARNSLPEEVFSRCRQLTASFTESLRCGQPEPLIQGIREALDWTEEHGEDMHLWQAGLGVLYQNLSVLLQLAPGVDPAFATGLLDHVRLEVGDQIQRQTTRSMLAHMDMSAQLGLLTAELLTAMDLQEGADILARHLPQLGLRNALVAVYTEDDEGEISGGRVLMCPGLPLSHKGRDFDPRKFPLPDIYAADEPLELTLLPLDVTGYLSGFVAFQAPNPELCAAIVHNLIAALRLSRLYHEAVDGQRLAEEANQLKSRFLSMVSHELRTPLSMIVGLSEMVLREQAAQPTLAPQVAQDIEQIGRSAQHLGRLLSDVLDLATSEAGELRMTCQAMDLADVLRAAAATGEQLARIKGLGWQYAIPESGLWVLGDRTRLKQVVLNLISNAVKYTDTGEVRLDVEADERHVTVSVSDTGIGIAAEEQTLIFKAFHRSARAVQRGYSGLGLGLAVSQQLIQHHGGAMAVQSPLKADHGARVSFTLPRAENPPAQETAPLTSARPTPAILLLVEEAAIGANLKEYLEGRGFEVRISTLGSDDRWLAEIAALRPAAVVLDESVAARRGWDVIGWLKRQAHLETVPVLVYALNTTLNQGELLELNYLLKPLQPEQLIGELARFGLERHNTILVVDDDANILATHSRIVQQAGYQAVPARNGREALAAVAQAAPDLILLDLIMPEMDGFEVLSRLRAQAETRRIPVIVVTGQALTPEDMERLNQGVTAVLSKGLFTAAETLQLIEARLARQSGLSSTAQRFVHRAIAFIQTHYAEPLNREKIARYVAISGNYLTDCFRQVIGITPTAYLTRYRLQRARQLLETTDLPITEIALATGFSEISHFTRTFKREVGLSPLAYRRGQQGA